VDFGASLERGSARFRLHGSKLRGEYALTRFREGADESWLLVKASEGQAKGPGKAAGTPDPRRARSVRSGRTLAQVASEARDR
jgi:hypothetical protein